MQASIMKILRRAAAVVAVSLTTLLAIRAYDSHPFFPFMMERI